MLILLCNMHFLTKRQYSIALGKKINVTRANFTSFPYLCVSNNIETSLVSKIYGQMKQWGEMTRKSTQLNHTYKYMNQLTVYLFSFFVRFPGFLGRP
jgi:hypothetical protein